jgi:tetratricopeptide (TPR) repeat protein
MSHAEMSACCESLRVYNLGRFICEEAWKYTCIHLKSGQTLGLASIPLRTSIIISIIFCVSLLSFGCSGDPSVRGAKFLERGKLAMKKKDYQRAVLEFSNAAKYLPKAAEPQYELALAYIGLNRLNQAVTALRRATELNPKNASAQVALSEVLSKSGDLAVLQDAEKRMLDVLAEPSANPEALDALAFTELRLGKADLAAEHLRQALEKSPGRSESATGLAAIKLRANDPAGAEQILKKAAQDAPKSADTALALGQLYNSLGRLEDAQRELERATRIDPRHQKALFALAWTHVKQGHKKEAEEIYRRIAALPDSEFSYIHAIYLMEENRYDEGIAELKALTKANPADRGVRTRLVAAYMVANRVSEAENILSESLKKNPKDLDALLQRSQLAIRAGKFEQAEQDGLQILRLRPDSAEAHYSLSKAYAARRSDLQNQELQEALRINPSMLYARVELARAFIAAGQPKTALHVMEETPAAQKKLIPAIVTRNWALLAIRDLPQLKKSVEEGLTISRAPDLIVQMAFVKVLEKDYAGAREQAEQVLKVSPGNAAALEVVIQSYILSKQTPLAIQRLTEIAATNAKSAPIQNLIGTWFLGLGSRNEARRAFATAKAADSTYYSADLSLADIELSDGKLDSARSILTSVISAQPGNVRARLMMASLETKAGNTKVALDQYRNALESDQRNLVALNNYAYLLAETRPDDALKQAEQALQLAPDAAAIQDTMGWIYYRKGQYSEAMNYLKRVVDKDPSPRRRLHLAMAYMKQGQEKLGREQLDIALKQDPNLAATERGW